MLTRQHIIRIAWVSLVVVTAAVSPMRKAFAGKPVYVGKRVAGTASFDQIDHSQWDRLLKKYVDQNGFVNYQGLQRSTADRQMLQQYLQSLSTVNPNQKASRQGQLAYWINAYNAVTVEGILQKYPTTSIRNHTAKLVGYNIWHDLKLHVGGQAYSLDFMEHKILRKMNEPRIHFAIVCASIGCPRLLNEAYTAQQLEQQLDTNTKDFFARSQNFRYDAASRRFYISAILDWFGSDFGATKSDQLRTISPWLPTRAAQQAAASNSVSMKVLDYNWQLNNQQSQAGR